MAMHNTKVETKRKMTVFTLIAFAMVAVALSGCNTVRGVAKDVTEAADALDPGE